MAHKEYTDAQMDRDYRYAKESMSWYGWGSPVGLGIMIVCVGLLLWLLHMANIIK